MKKKDSLEDLIEVEEQLIKDNNKSSLPLINPKQSSPNKYSSWDTDQLTNPKATADYMDEVDELLMDQGLLSPEPVKPIRPATKEPSLGDSTIEELLKGGSSDLFKEKPIAEDLDKLILEETRISPQ